LGLQLKPVIVALSRKGRVFEGTNSKDFSKKKRELLGGGHISKKRLVSIIESALEALTREVKENRKLLAEK